MTKIYLSQYYARSFARTVRHAGQTRSWFLAGDAAMGMPFYRSINSGLILGSRLAHLLSMSAMPATLKIAMYNRWIKPCRIACEFTRVARTEVLIRFVKNVARPALLVLTRSPLGPLIDRHVDHIIGYLKYGRVADG